MPNCWRSPSNRGSTHERTEFHEQYPSSRQDVVTTVPKNIRVYELAREMGMTNAEVLDLCVSLGIGVKSHSSGMVEAQADRARRKADREGLRREVQPEEAVEEKPAKAKAKATGAKAKAKATGAKAKATEAKPAGTEPAQDEPTGGGTAAATEAPVVAEPSQPVESVESVEPAAVSYTHLRAHET